jgi:hypothetical protein
LKYKAGMHPLGKKGGNFIPSTYKELMGEKNPKKE